MLFDIVQQPAVVDAETTILRVEHAIRARNPQRPVRTKLAIIHNMLKNQKADAAVEEQSMMRKTIE